MGPKRKHGFATPSQKPKKESKRLRKKGCFSRRKRAGGSHHKKKKEKQKEPDLSQSPPDEAQLAANRAKIKQIENECFRLKPKQGSALTKGEACVWCLLMNRMLAKVLDKNLTAHLDDVYKDAIREVATRFADEQGFNRRRVIRVYTQYHDNLNSTDEDKRKDPVPDFRGEMAEKRKVATRSFQRCFPKLPFKLDPENADEEPRLSFRPYELVMENALAKFKGHVTLQYIKEMFSKELNANGSKKTISQFLHQVLGYNYCRADAVVRKLTTERLARIRRFLIEYADALQKERAGTHIIVVMDESYCHQNHHGRQWHPAEAVSDGTSGKGGRMIMAWAMTKFGLVMEERRDGQVQDPDVTNIDRKYLKENYKSQPKILRARSSELVFISGRMKGKDGKFIGEFTRGDYHDNFDGHVFQKWVENRLAPAFEAQFPGKKMILILDNAKYHHGLVEDFIGVGEKHTPTLAQLYKWCDEENIESITIYVDQESTKKRKKAFGWKTTDARKEISINRMPQGKGKDHGGTVKNYTGETFMGHHCGGPVAAEIKLALRNHLLQNNPLRLMTKLARYFYNERGWELIWTPPYCPDLQPIEKLWAFIKNRVGANWGGRTRTMMELYDQIMVATYGGQILIASGENNKKASRETIKTGKFDPGFQPDNAANFFRHCLVSKFNERLRRDPLLGTWVDPKKENTNAENSTDQLKLESVSALDDLWKEVLEGGDGQLSTRAAKLKQLSIDCNAFPDRRLYEGHLRALPEPEEGLELSDDEELPDE